MSYNSKPRRKHIRGHRKGVEPAGLKRWRLAHKKHDPRPRRRSVSMGRRKRIYRGGRGGRFFMAGLGTKMKRRYDPRPRRHFSVRSVGGEAERALSGKWGWLAGGIAALVYGVYQGLNDTAGMLGGKITDGDTLKGYGMQVTGGTMYGQKVYPSISNLWQNNLYKNPLSYLCYRFTGYNPDTKTWTGSAWVAPFWASFRGLNRLNASAWSKSQTHPETYEGNRHRRFNRVNNRSARASSNQSRSSSQRKPTPNSRTQRKPVSGTTE